MCSHLLLLASLTEYWYLRNDNPVFWESIHIDSIVFFTCKYSLYNIYPSGEGSTSSKKVILEINEEVWKLFLSLPDDKTYFLCGQSNKLLQWQQACFSLYCADIETSIWVLDIY